MIDLNNDIHSIYTALTLKWYVPFCDSWPYHFSLGMWSSKYFQKWTTCEFDTDEVISTFCKTIGTFYSLYSRSYRTVVFCYINLDVFLWSWWHPTMLDTEKRRLLSINLFMLCFFFCRLHTGHAVLHNCKMHICFQKIINSFL